ncbi:unnamed protein product [Notodromas monacha]|uniref:Alpha-ketoglutarate-dependent dioxygenase AlkB-like domain-containing protein n=1 Tax=Notodromas monacha TaxID=399045 RepID=A0A7R9BKY4_9CRUS|nr:unnamed protein product [Notodromas monacha]CAG0917396.1 unnamed protein product [Notodromas monacha]
MNSAPYLFPPKEPVHFDQIPSHPPQSVNLPRGTGVMMFEPPPPPSSLSHYSLACSQSLSPPDAWRENPRQSVDFDADNVHNYVPPSDLRLDNVANPRGDDAPKATTQGFHELWALVQSDPHNFDLWSTLLSHVETKNKDNLEAQRGVFNAFLPLYPYCYMYWKKYAMLESTHGNDDRALSILDRGLEAIPLSIDLWVTYLDKFKSLQSKDDLCSEAAIRGKYEMAVKTAGLDFRSDPLWSHYIKWEKSAGRLQKVSAVYKRLISIPTKAYAKHWDDFLDLIRQNHPEKLVNEIELKELLRTCGGIMKEDKLREAFTAKWLCVHEATKQEYDQRIKFENKIKRTYFHVKPLDLKQIKNWHKYLDFEIEKGNQERIVILFERCLIACAHYETFWVRYMETVVTQGSAPKFESKENIVGLESDLPVPGKLGVVAGLTKTRDQLDAVRQIYRRACVVHCPKWPDVKLQWAAFEEENGDSVSAEGLIQEVITTYPELVSAKIRLVELERRRGDFDKVQMLLEKFTEEAHSKSVASFFAIQHSRFIFKILGLPEKALVVLRKALKNDKGNVRLYNMVQDICYQRHPVDIKGFCAASDLAVLSKELDDAHKVKFAQRKALFLREFGNLAEHRKAMDAIEDLKKKYNEELNDTRFKVQATQTGDESDHTIQEISTNNERSSSKPLVASNGKRTLPMETKIPSLLSIKTPLILDVTPLEPVSPTHSEPKTLCIPEWFVNDGGDFVISDGVLGKCVLRYWPEFLSNRRNERMCSVLDKAVPWKLKQSRTGPSLHTSWHGQCDYTNEELKLLEEKNDKWPEELLDVLHRAIALVGMDFNSCLALLCRDGMDWVPPRSEDQAEVGKALGVAVVCLGAGRTLEFLPKLGNGTSKRLWMRPGSLLVMEGAVQKDWLHQFPAEPGLRSRSLLLTLKIMYAVQEEVPAVAVKRRREVPPLMSSFVEPTGIGIASGLQPVGSYPSTWNSSTAPHVSQRFDGPPPMFSAPPERRRR